MPIRVDQRVRATQDRLGDLDALLVGDLTNIRWLTGFTGSNAMVVLQSDRVVLVTDGRYGAQAERQLSAAGCDAEVRVAHTSSELLSLAIDSLETNGRVGFESAHTTHQRYVQLGAAVNGELVGVTGIVEAGRRCKDVAEIERIAEACRIADAALAMVAPSIMPGATEVSIRNDLERVMRELGADGPSYETIVATGPANAPLPHHRPTKTVIEAGHTVIIDVGALVDGYHSDMTRTFVVGEPTALQHEVYEAVLAAQRAGIDAVRPGIAAAELDAVCRDIITEAGFGPWFGHGTGHGVGLLIHEDPFVNRAGTALLEDGDVVTVEPGVYREDLGGVRIEDLVQVTSTGCRTLTRTAKDSPCLPSAPTT